MNSSIATVTVLTGSSSRAASREHSLEINGWTARRREVIERDAGVCALCGREAADTASHSPELGDLVAAHTRCLVGLGPPVNFMMAA